LPNNKGTREGLGFKRDCVICKVNFEIFSARQIRCRNCAKLGRNMPIEISIARGNKVYMSKKRKLA